MFHQTLGLPKSIEPVLFFLFLYALILTLILLFAPRKSGFVKGSGTVGLGSLVVTLCLSLFGPWLGLIIAFTAFIFLVRTYNNGGWLGAVSLSFLAMIAARLLATAVGVGQISVPLLAPILQSDPVSTLNAFNFPSLPNSTDIIFLATILVSGIITVRLLLNLASHSHRRRYAKVVRYNFVAGLIFGLIVPWNTDVGLITAAMGSIVLLTISSMYHLVGKRQFLRGRLSISSERMRDWLLYFSVTTGVVGIVSTAISVLVPPFLSFGQLSSFVPLAFDTLSVLAALLEFTIVIPPYTTIHSLVYHLAGEAASVPPPNTLEVYTKDFGRIIEGTHYTVLDIQESMEHLVRMGFAKRSKSSQGAAYEIPSHGLMYLKACHNKISFRGTNDKDILEARLLGLQQTLETADDSTQKARSKILSKMSSELHEIKWRANELLEEFGPILGPGWSQSVSERIERIGYRIQLHTSLT